MNKFSLRIFLKIKNKFYFILFNNLIFILQYIKKLIYLKNKIYIDLKFNSKVNQII
jgi:hypothetical protein